VSAKGRPERELLHLGGKARSAKGAPVSALTQDCQRATVHGMLALAAAWLPGCALSPPGDLPAAAVFAPTRAVAPAIAPVALGARSIGDGLPRAGQWRSQVAIADANGDGRLDLVLPPARKGDGRPRIFVAQPDGTWSRWAAMRQPRFRYDYGGIAALDFDGDGRLDLALGMHLQGVMAMRQQGAPGEFHDASDGLNEGADGKALPAGSLSLAVLQAPAGTRPRLFVAYEVQRMPGAPGASIWDFDGTRWRRQDVLNAPRGTHAFAAAGMAYYLSGAGIVRVDVHAPVLGAQLVGPLGGGRFGHALALGSNGDAFVASSIYKDKAWIRRIERFPALMSAPDDRAVAAVATTIERGGRVPFTAVAATAGAPWGLPGEILAVGDEQGELLLYHIGPDQSARRIGEVTVASWRTRCPVSYLIWAPLTAGEPPRLVAAFSGELSAYDLEGGCESGGGVDVFAIRP